MAYPLDTLLDQAMPLAGRLSAWRRELHRNPELPLEEEQTARLVEKTLDELGVSHRRVGPTGVLAVIAGQAQNAPHKVVALRADMDALPVCEVDDPARAAYRSQVEGRMHACGHDAHVAMLLGVAEVLAANVERFGGEVRLIFQPAEEIGRGARPFVDEGVLDGVDRIFGMHVSSDLPLGTVCLKPGPNNASVDHFAIDVEGVSTHVAQDGVDRIFGMHVSSDLPLGTVCLKPGPNNASVDHFAIDVEGVSTHVAHPELGVDALYIGSQIVVGLQAIVTRRLTPVEPLIIGMGVFESGTAYNIVAPHAHIEGTTRTVCEQTRAWVRGEIERVAQSMAAAYGGSATVSWTDVCAALVNDAEPCAEASAVAEAVFGRGNVIHDRPQSMGGDNFADLMVTPATPVPGAYAFLGSASDTVPGSGSSHHAVDFDIDERALPSGVALLAGCALYHLGV